MKCEKLLVDLNNHIVHKLLHLDTVAHFLDESLEFEIPALKDITMKIITARFKHIVDTAPDFMYTIPQDIFERIIRDPELNINEENDLVQWVKAYILFREKHDEDINHDPETNAGTLVWNSLT